MILDYEKGPFYRYSSSTNKKMLYRLMQNGSFCVGAELEKDRYKGVEMRQRNSLQFTFKSGFR